ncbi:MAG: L-2-amino-thiazoline-4-carboxylic acid hydrolase [Ruminococcus sp.]|nr:L-2-amino-thiazoline-4-carboxylic acid hydrolase [Ruminococcus sp.]
MKKYIPEKMIMQSRFRDEYSSWESGRQKNLADRVGQLISENSDYADDKNYGHLCNLLTALGMVLLLKEEGMSQENAVKTVGDVMYRFITPQIDSMKKLGSMGCFVSFLRLTMPIKFSRTLGYGWDVEFPKADSGDFTMITHACIYQQIFSRYGIPELTAVFCKVDDILYCDLSRAEFIYTEQIGTGGSMCDYTFRKR